MSSICTVLGCGLKPLARGLCDKHYQRVRANGTTKLVSELPLRERLMLKIEIAPDNCWVWKGVIAYDGYGVAKVDNKRYRAHRLVYETFKAPIPDGLVIDHLCRNRACCNPDHLEPVTTRVNILRGVGPSALAAVKTACAKGHPFAGSNLIIRSNGQRACRICRTSKPSSKTKQVHSCATC